MNEAHTYCPTMRFLYALVTKRQQNNLFADFIGKYGSGCGIPRKSGVSAECF